MIEHTQKIYKFKQGQAVILATIFFTVLSSLIGVGFAVPAVRQLHSAREAVQSKQGYYLAEAGIEDVVYRLKQGMTVDTSENLTLNGEQVTTVTSNSAGGKTVEAEGNWNEYIRNLRVDMVAGTGISFSYGVQAGQGGFSLDNNAGVYGNVYSNGNITGSNNTFIHGTAVAANSAALTTDQSNTSPTPPTSSVVFRNASATQDFAQSFSTSTTSPINKVDFYIKKNGSPSSATVRIVNDSGGSPGSIQYTTSTLTNSQVTTSYGWVTVTFAPNIVLNEGTTYWIVIDNSSNSSSSYYTIGANTSYTGGTGKVGQFGGTWNNTSPTGLDGYFRLYLGGLTSTISNITVGTGGVGDAYAHTVNSAIVHGNLYCQTGSSNKNESNQNISCNTSLSDPSPQAFPISEANIDQWKSDAEAGGVVSGNYAPTGASSSLGPKKITGNLVLPGNHTLNITGTIWVQGNIIAPNNNTFRLSSGYGTASGVVIADGYISLDNNINFYGSGQSGSYVLMLSTSACPLAGSCDSKDAIELGNNVGSVSDQVVVYAQNGTIDFTNNAEVKEATGYQIHLSNNVYINYESGLINSNFTSGPGGAWNITDWREVE